MRKEPDPKTDHLAYEVIGAAIRVHRTLGPGLLESVYEAALCLEFRALEIPFTRQATVTINYRGQPVGQSRIDIMIGNVLILEVKAVEMLGPVHTAQIISYLKITGCELGLLINFNVPVLKLGIRRVVLTT